MRSFIFLSILLLSISLFAKTSIKEKNISSIRDLEYFIVDLQKRGVLPKSIPVRIASKEIKFDEVTFKYKTPLKWNTTTKCPINQDEIIDASEEKNSVFNCGSGNTVFMAGDGNDLIRDAWGSDIVYTGKGDDVIDLGNPSDIVIFEKGWGKDKLKIEGFQLDTYKVMDQNYRWKFSSFIVFGKGIKPNDLFWEDDRLIHKETGDFIEIKGDLNANIVFHDDPNGYLHLPQKPKKINLINVPSINFILFDQSTAYVQKVDELLIVDLNDSTQLSSINIEGFSNKMIKQENYLFIAHNDGKRGIISVVNIKDPSRPQLIQSLKFKEPIYKFIILDKKLIFPETNMFSNTGNIHVLDISNPIKIKEILIEHLNFYADTIIFDNQMLWLPDTTEGFLNGYELRKKNYLNNTLRIAIGSWITDIQMFQAYVAISTHKKIYFYPQLSSYDVKPISSIDLNIDFSELAVMRFQENYLILSKGARGIFVYDMGNISEPKLIYTVSSSKFITKIFIFANQLYCIDGEGNMSIINLEIPKISQNIK